MGASNFSHRGADRHCYRAQMHSDKRISDVNAAVSLNPLHCRRILKSPEHRCGEGTSRLQLWHYVYLFQTVLLGALLLHNESPV